MKKIIKISAILVIICIIQFSFNYCYAWEPQGTEGDASTGDIGVDTMVDPGDYEPASDNDSTLRYIAGLVATVIRNVGIVVAVVALMIIGLKSMVLSTEEKAAYKEALPGYLIGVVLVVAMTFIPSLIQSWVNA